MWSGTDEALAIILAQAIQAGELLTMKAVAEACATWLPDDPNVIFYARQEARRRAIYRRTVVLCPDA